MQSTQESNPRGDITEDILMVNPIQRTVVLLLLLSGSAALLLEPSKSTESGDATELLPKNKDKLLTAMIARNPGIPEVRVSAPEMLAGPIPLPPAAMKPVVNVTAKAPRQATRTIKMLVTAYCPCRKCCGKFSDNVTASGKSIYTNRSMFVAADTRLLKFGTMLSIPGYRGGQAVPVLDRGGKIRGYRLDVFYLSHSQARKWGRRYLNVRVISNRR
jgi:3D (Asp-Asp-Asp) domain-containing protein